MLELSPKTNLLEENDYRYSLQDVKEPILYRDVYSYEEVPKIAFNHRRVPMSMPEDIWITDTSFRDGQQSVNPYTTDQIVELYKLMNRLGGPYGLIRQTEFFIYSKKDREAVERCQALGLRFPEITTWIRASREDFRLVKDLGIRETGILVSCSDYHIFKKLKMTRRQAMEHYLAAVKDAFDAHILVDRFKPHPIGDVVHFHVTHGGDRIQSHGWEIIAVPADHDKREECLVYICKKNDKTFFYGHDTGIKLSDEAWKLIAAEHYDLVSLDATMGTKRIDGYHMGLADDEIMFAKLAELGCTDDHTVKVINHFSHNGEMTHDQLEAWGAQRGIHVAYDGMEIEF